MYMHKSVCEGATMGCVWVEDMEHVGITES